MKMAIILAAFIMLAMVPALSYALDNWPSNGVHGADITYVDHGPRGGRGGYQYHGGYRGHPGVGRHRGFDRPSPFRGPLGHQRHRLFYSYPWYGWPSGYFWNGGYCELYSPYNGYRRRVPDRYCRNW